ncbi:hypothetical protein HMPREF2967_01285 [Corynebacterium sp. HMSC059E07]|nr:hypothetical protein HMPREF2967_01285 [Corynebacterium sp. HMSC059E07]
MREFLAGDCLDGDGEAEWKWYGGVDGFAANNELKVAAFLECSHEAFVGVTTAGSIRCALANAAMTILRC